MCALPPEEGENTRNREVRPGICSPTTRECLCARRNVAARLTAPAGMLLWRQDGLAKPKEEKVKSYVFRVILEPDEDAWRAYIPELEAKGAATWGNTKEEALRNIHEVAQMVIEALLEDGEPLPPSVTELD